MGTRREAIQERIGERYTPEAANASLWLDKFIYSSKKDGKSRSNDDETAKAELVRQVSSIAEPEVYKTFYVNSWIPNLHSAGAKLKEAQIKNRLAIGLGLESVLETSISLHRVYGLPFIPGSSLKGMAAAFVRNYGGSEWEKDHELYSTVFGDDERAGFISFYDALYVPGSGFKTNALYADVMTSHHPDYYGEKKINTDLVLPADWDSPNPVPFISATGRFLIALSAPEGCEDWLNLTFEILGFALKYEGVGAKTSSGYGRSRYSSDFILTNDELEEQKSRQLMALLDEMERLVDGDKVTKKAVKKKLKDYTKGLDNADPSIRDIVRRFAAKINELEIRSDLEETKPDWFKNLTEIVPLNEEAFWIGKDEE